MTSVSMRQRLEAGVHFGHQTRFLEPEDGPVRQSIKRLNELDDMAQNGSLERRGKKEAQMLRREMDKLLRSLGGTAT